MSKVVWNSTLEKVGSLTAIDLKNDMITLLSRSGMHSKLTRIGGDSKICWSANIPFAANSMATGENGVFITGFTYRKSEQGISISTPVMAKISWEGKLLWNRAPHPPVADRQEHWREGTMDLSPNGAAYLWKVLALPGGGCVAMGLQELKQGQALYHIRLDKNGRTIWNRVCSIVRTNWMYTFPGKIEPTLTRHSDRLHNIGAYNMNGSDSGVGVFVVDIRSGKVQNKFSEEETNLVYTSAAVSDTGKLAIGWIRYGQRKAPAGISVLSPDLKKITELTTSVQPWSGIGWATENEVQAIGRIPTDENLISRCGTEVFQVKKDPSSRPTVYKNSNLKGYARLGAKYRCFINNRTESNQHQDRSSIEIHQREDGWTHQSQTEVGNISDLQMSEEGNGAVIGCTRNGSDLLLFRCH